MLPIPAGACDCHNHIVGMQDSYPMDPNRVYTAGSAPVSELLAERKKLGISRNVLIQASFYGTDNRCMLDALAQLGDTARGVVVVRPDISEDELRAFDAQGVKGIRVNLETSGNRDPKAASQALAALGTKLAPLGWHIQLYAMLSVIDQIAEQIAALPVPVVIDHFGRAVAALGAGQPGFSTLLDLVRARKIYVKLSGSRHISKAAGETDVAPLAHALIDAGFDRLLWGSDWPHTSRRADGSRTEVAPFANVDDVAQLALLRSWCRDEKVWKSILSTTPEGLYRFGPV
jgi:predicted TIM-barrel fold metal-dependent hydrolase